MSPHSGGIGRHFVHYPCFSDTHMLPDGHFPIDWANLWEKNKELKHYSSGETVCNGYGRGFLTLFSLACSVPTQCNRKGYWLVNASLGGFE